MTVAMLLQNTLESAKRKLEEKQVTVRHDVL